MFKKLNLPLLDLTLEDLTLTQGYVNTPNFNEFKIQNQDLLNKRLGQVLQFLLPPDEVNITTITYPGTRAHRDGWPTALNFYLTAGTERTWIWRIRDGVMPSTPANASKYVSVFEYKDLEQVDSYVAQQHDFYLLSTNTIHSVWKDQGSAPRHILRFAWREAEFDQVLASIVPV